MTGLGMHDGIPETDYHSDAALDEDLRPSLSASGAKTLLRSPARFDWERRNGGRTSSAMDFGTLVHTLVLRSHDERIVVSPYDSLRTNAAKDWTAEQEAAGRIVVSAKDVRRAIGVAKAVREHPLAGAILAEGRPEVTLYWRDAETGVTCRARIDWLNPKAIVDVKTVGKAGGSELGPFGRQAASLDYPVSAAQYVAGVAALTGETLPFITIAVEVDPPHFITVGVYDHEDLAIGYERMRAALTDFAARTASGVWVDPPQIETFPLPVYYGR